MEARLDEKTRGIIIGVYVFAYEQNVHNRKSMTAYMTNPEWMKMRSFQIVDGKQQQQANQTNNEMNNEWAGVEARKVTNNRIDRADRRKNPPVWKRNRSFVIIIIIKIGS